MELLIIVYYGNEMDFLNFCVCTRLSTIQLVVNRAHKNFQRGGRILYNVTQLCQVALSEAQGNLGEATNGSGTSYRLLYDVFGRQFSIIFASYSYYHISLFMSFFDIPVSFGHLFQRIASIYDCFNPSRLNMLSEEN